ncbi:MAG: amidinotransferase [Bacteroidetes bacterium]|jgi:N-dimethylarginine dimethylaminohydrolase|nr:amidinotransferase [Bacteroidota bacterium]
MGIKLNIHDETSTLDTVILGIGVDMGGPGTINPKSKFHLEQDTYPRQEDIQKEMDQLERTLLENGVKVFKPVNIKNKTQLFTRDLGFVIGDEFFVSNILDSRKKEVEAIEYLLDLFDQDKIIRIPDQEIRIEGGDVIINGDTIFVGLSARTNDKGYQYMKEYFFKKKNVVQIKLEYDKGNHRENSLHLDCAFQPVGKNHAIVYEKGIKNISTLYDTLNISQENIYQANEWQFIRMFPNILSLAADKIIIEKEFIDLKYWLLDKGFTVIEINYNQISKLSGLLRCSTLPLIRK